jgi:hypothetical protein
VRCRHRATVQVDDSPAHTAVHLLATIAKLLRPAGRAIGSCFVSIVFREHAVDNVFVDIDTKGACNLLCDAGTANTGLRRLNSTIAPMSSFDGLSLLKISKSTRRR